MRRSVLMGMLAFGLLLTGLLAVDSRFIVLALPVWVYLGASLLDAPDPAPALTVTRVVDPPVVTEGEQATVTVQVRNDGACPVWLRVEEHLPSSLPVCDGDLSGGHSKSFGITDHSFAISSGMAMTPEVTWRPWVRA